jgi:hypothetical protein
MPKSRDLTDLKINRWTVIRKAPKPENRKNSGVYWLCRCDCGNVGVIPTSPLLDGRSKSCGCWKKEVQKRTRENSKGWKGGRFVDENGYVKIYCPGHAPKALYVREHILVMEEYLGRRLLKEETVHHLNGIRDDNRIENLELWSKSHPPGQRVEDKIKWAKQILELYKVNINE